MSVSNAQICHITIDASKLNCLDDRNFYQLVALEIVGQLLKKAPCESLLNIPVPKNHYYFRLFLQAVREVLPVEHGTVLIVLRNQHLLTDLRKERFMALFKLDKGRTCQKIGLVLT
ncbi:hypothetical protein MFMK1_002293 [Metallumcola ferriviriculae]|uniref:Uncharacterized protein n=1 Tax=Metallumcola ferriviriculae TaxID=3039180 RepID=A0AAU0UM91_9FIRM|nr:hypothetical protein MFMK1_002293 [Desulfitibacteraceae bacterium MK1]